MLQHTLPSGNKSAGTVAPAIWVAKRHVAPDLKRPLPTEQPTPLRTPGAFIGT